MLDAVRALAWQVGSEIILSSISEPNENVILFCTFALDFFSKLEARFVVVLGLKPVTSQYELHISYLLDNLGI